MLPKGDEIKNGGKFKMSKDKTIWMCVGVKLAVIVIFMPLGVEDVRCDSLHARNVMKERCVL
jgi:hypothetical protein